MRMLTGRVVALDRRVLDQVAAAESTALDHVLPRLGVAADYGRLWMGVAAALALCGRGDARRGAARGLASLALASTAANVVAKSLSGRIRPRTEVPPLRQLRRTPLTTSFPSGHSASAAAFATGAALEMPALGIPLGALAAAVAASRVVTAAHFPSDVAAGLGLGMAAAGITLLLRPRRRRGSSAIPALFVQAQ